MAVSHDPTGADDRHGHPLLPSSPHALLRQPLAAGVAVDEDVGVGALLGGIPDEVVQGEDGQRGDVAEAHATVGGKAQRRLGSVHVAGEKLLNLAAEVDVRTVVDEGGVLVGNLRPIRDGQTEVLGDEISTIALDLGLVGRIPDPVVLHVALQPAHGRPGVRRTHQAADLVASHAQVADDEGSQEATASGEEHSCGASARVLELPSHGGKVGGLGIIVVLPVGPGVQLGACLGLATHGGGSNRLGGGGGGTRDLLGLHRRPGPVESHTLLAGADLGGLPLAREGVADLVATGDAHALPGQAQLIDGGTHQRQSVADPGDRERRQAGSELETHGLGRVDGVIDLVDQSHLTGLDGSAGHIVHVQGRGVLVANSHAQVVGEQQTGADTAWQVAVVEQRALVGHTVVGVEAGSQPTAHDLAVHNGDHGSSNVAQRNEGSVDLVGDLPRRDDGQLLGAANEVVGVNAHAEVVASALEHHGTQLLVAGVILLLGHLLEPLNGTAKVIGHGPVDGVAMGGVVELQDSHTGLGVELDTNEGISLALTDTVALIKGAHGQQGLVHVACGALGVALLEQLTVELAETAQNATELAVDFLWGTNEIDEAVLTGCLSRVGIPAAHPPAALGLAQALLRGHTDHTGETALADLRETEGGAGDGQNVGGVAREEHTAPTGRTVADGDEGHLGRLQGVVETGELLQTQGHGVIPEGGGLKVHASAEMGGASVTLEHQGLGGGAAFALDGIHDPLEGDRVEGLAQSDDALTELAVEAALDGHGGGLRGVGVAARGASRPRLDGGVVGEALDGGRGGGSGSRGRGGGRRLLLLGLGGLLGGCTPTPASAGGLEDLVQEALGGQS
mmetsp:Transcript_53048/g.94668  ORF Transcript_53048/g.94668 Transcript_53048/m.94668 type:complete len:848 (-) Transcript_53048:6596-9139(-)